MKHSLLYISLLMCVPTAKAQIDDISAEEELQRMESKQSESFSGFVRRVNKEYDDFRRRANKEYASFMEQVWPEIRLNEPVRLPKEEDVKPQPYKDDGKPLEDFAIKIEVVPVIKQELPQPQPIAPIKPDESDKDYTNLPYYGTQMMVRLGKINSFRLKGNEEKHIADGFRKLTGKDCDNLIFDCLKLRKDHKLCDWAYYKLLQTVSESAFAKGSNEAVLMLGVLLNQSGYDIRFGKDPDNGELHLLICTDAYIPGAFSSDRNNKTYLILDGYKKNRLQVFERSYPKEQFLQLGVSQLPLLAQNLSEQRTIAIKEYKLSADVAMNKNLINFFNECPNFWTDNDFMTRWAYYANTPVSPEIRETLYPQLRAFISNIPEVQAAGMLLTWLQFGLTYEFDNTVWGTDRAFFAEETLFYPFCDCEDRAILYSHLVRDLLGLDVVLVFYPGHLATAVNFKTTQPRGDYFMLDGKRFTIADPTLEGGSIGMTMPGMDKTKAKVILLKKDL